MTEESKHMDSSKQSIIMIHGTFAASDSDLREQWWQHGSVFCQELVQHLPSSFGQPTIEEAFHWQGSNSATDRRSAAKELLRLMNKHEEAKQPYHLIGHSHGGSVIWDALLLAYLKRKKLSLLGNVAKSKSKIEPLSHLQSWTTVGTPFVFQKPSGLNVTLSIFSGVLLSAIIISVITYLFIGLPPEIRGTVQTLGFTGGFIFLFYISLSSTISGMEAERLDKERRASWHVMRAFGDRWLGLWHREDEAINGLRASLNLSGDIVSRRTKLWSAFAYPQLSVLFAPLSLVYNPIFNWLLAPLGDHFVWERIKNKTVGNDRPGSKVKGLSASPMEFLEETPPLPRNVTLELAKAADEAATRSLPKLRALLCRLGGGIGAGIVEEIKASGFSGKELIHTSYFESAAIQKILANHMATKVGCIETLEFDPETKQWMVSYQSALQKYLDAEPERSFSLIVKVLFLIFVLVALGVLTYKTYPSIVGFFIELVASKNI